MSVPDPAVVDWVPLWSLGPQSTVIPPVVNGQWVKGVGGAAVWSAIVAADLPAQAVPTYGTTFPASPADGAEHVLVDSVTSATYQWRFRFNAGSTSAYKWEFLGGSDVTIDIATWTSSGQNAWQYTGAGIYPPRAGVYDVESQCRAQNPAGGQQYMGVGVSGTTPPIVLAYGGSGQGWMRGRSRHTIVAGDYFSQATYSSVTLGTFDFRSLAVRPVRCA